MRSRVTACSSKCERSSVSHRPGTSAQRRVASSGTGTIEPACGSIRTCTPSAAPSSTRQASSSTQTAHAPSGSSAHVTPGRTVTPAMPSSDTTRAAAANSRRPRARRSRSRRLGALSSTVAPIARNRSSLASPWASSDARSPNATAAGSATSSVPSARKSAISTSSNPSSRTMPMRSSCPGTPGNEYSLQEIRVPLID